MSDTRPPIAAGPIARALTFLNKMSVNFGDAASDAGLGETDVPVEIEGLALAEDEAWEAPGRVPASVAEGACARATPSQARKSKTAKIVFTTSYLDRTDSFVDSVAEKNSTASYSVSLIDV